MAKLERVREIEKDRAAVVLSDRELARIAAEAKRDKDGYELERVQDDMRLSEGKPLSVESLLELEYYSQVVRRTLNASTELLNRALTAEGNARTDLLEKAQRAKAVTLYREHKFEEYSRENSRLEQKEIDETAGNQYIRTLRDATT